MRWAKEYHLWCRTVPLDGLSCSRAGKRAGKRHRAPPANRVQRSGTRTSGSSGANALGMNMRGTCNSHSDNELWRIEAVGATRSGEQLQLVAGFGLVVRFRVVLRPGITRKDTRANRCNSSSTDEFGLRALFFGVRVPGPDAGNYANLRWVSIPHRASALRGRKGRNGERGHHGRAPDGTLQPRHGVAAGSQSASFEMRKSSKRIQCSASGGPL